MSSEATLVTARHFAYVAERTAGDDDFLTQLKAAAAEAGIPAIWINPAQASLMAILLKLVGAKQVVEVGTLAGYSAIAMARALPADGRVATIELETKHADFAEDYIRTGDRVYVEGRMEYDSYERDGVVIPTAEITVREIVLLSSKSAATAPEEMEDAA